MKNIIKNFFKAFFISFFVISVFNIYIEYQVEQANQEQILKAIQQQTAFILEQASFTDDVDPEFMRKYDCVIRNNVIECMK